MKALTDRIEVTVDFAFKHMDADINMWTFNKEADEMGLDPWRQIELTQDVNGVTYYIGYYNTYSSQEKKVPFDYKIWVLKKDLPAPTLEEAEKMIRELMTELKYQLASKHGPKAAYEHLNVRLAREFLERFDVQKENS